MLFEFKRQKKQHVFCTYIIGAFEGDTGDVVFSMFGEDSLEEMSKSVNQPLCRHVYSVGPCRPASFETIFASENQR
jgi:hypothetical protein